MTQGLETFAADEFIYGQLKNDATLMGLLNAAYSKYGQPPVAAPEIYAETIVPDVTYPYIIFQMHTALPDSTVVNGIRIWSRLDYLVKVVDREQSYSTIAPIYSRMDQLLHLTAGTVADGQVYWSQRIRPFRMPEVDDAIQYRHMGGIYRITVQS